MSKDKEDNEVGLVGIVAFMVFFIASVVAALLAAGWVGREANALSPHHFEKGEDGIITCRFEMSKIGIVLSASFMALIYSGLSAGYLGVVAVGMGFPEIGTAVWWAVVFGPLFLVLAAGLSTHRFNQLAALQALVWERPSEFKLSEHSAKAVGFLSARDAGLYKLYAKAVPHPADAPEWTALASAGACPHDVERWASVRRILPPPASIDTICPKFQIPT